MSGLQAPSLSVRAREKRTERVVQTRQILCASSSVTAGIFADKAVRIEPRSRCLSCLWTMSKDRVAQTSPDVCVRSTGSISLVRRSSNRCDLVALPPRHLRCLGHPKMSIFVLRGTPGAQRRAWSFLWPAASARGTRRTCSSACASPRPSLARARSGSCHPDQRRVAQTSPDVCVPQAQD